MAGKKTAKIGSRSGSSRDSVERSGEFVAVHYDDIRQAVYPHPKGVSEDEAKRTALQPIDWKTRQYDASVPRRVVIRMSVYNAHRESTEPVAYNSL